MHSFHTFHRHSRAGGNPSPNLQSSGEVRGWIPAFAGMTKLGAALLAVQALAACTPNDPTLGGAVRHNYALQVIDPDPQYAGQPNEGGSGDLAKGAVERYRTDKVKKPKTIRTTSKVSGGSGGGGSN